MIVDGENFISFPFSDYLIPFSSEEENDIRNQLTNLNDGKLILVKDKQRNENFSFVKFGDLLISQDYSVDNTYINELDLYKYNILGFNHNFQFIYKGLNTIQKDFKVIPFFESLSCLCLNVLGINGKYGTIKFEIKSINTLVITTTNIEKEITKETISISQNNITVYASLENNILQIYLSNSTIESLKYDVSKFIGAKDKLLIRKLSTTDKLQKITYEIVQSYMNASTNEEQNEIFENIIKSISKNETDQEKRYIGLQVLKTIYKNGSVDLINNLWKECKKSFDVQPYNIIDIKELVMDSELGRGTFGCVKKATWDSIDGRMNVAVKIIQENNQMFDLSDLRGEFVALSLLEHENIIKMHGGGFIEQDLGIHNSIHWFIVMDLMDGNIAEIIKKSYNSLTFKDKLNITYQILLGLHHLHKHKIIHRDIKPENILYKKESNEYLIKIADLGISKPATDTILRTAIGTHEYMAPELCNTKTGRAEFGKEVDIYSLGILLWELFTGMTSNDFSISRKQSRFKGTNIKFPSRIPTWITKLITHCTSTNPQKRPTTDTILQIFEKNQAIQIKPRKKLEKFKKKKSFSKQSKVKAKRSVSLKKTVFWYNFDKNDNVWRRFSVTTSNLFESQYNNWKLDKNQDSELSLNELKDNGSYNIDFYSFCLINNETKDITHYIRRKRPITTCGSTSIIDVNFNNLQLSVIGDKNEDCSDEVISVIYSYFENASGTNLIRKMITKPPYLLKIENYSITFVNIFIDINTYPAQTFEIRLNEDFNKTIILNKNQVLQRYIRPSFDPYSTESLENQKLFVNTLMRQQVDIILSQLQEYYKEDLSNCDMDIYTGISGIGYYFWKLSKSSNYENHKSEFLDTACSLLKQSEKYIEIDGSIGFLCSIYGVYALLSVVYYNQNNIKESKHYSDLLIDFTSFEENNYEYEILFGYAGYMASILFLMKHIPKEYYNTKKAKKTLFTCFGLFFTDELDTIIYTFQNTKYLGAAHGLAGILYVLLHVPQLAIKSMYKPKIINSLNILLSNCTEDFQFPPFKNSSKVLNHWCHGTPGIIPTLLQAYKIFGDSKYLKIAKDSIEIIYEKGILRKGYNLCHGICGNAYSFLYMYQITKNSKYLYYALNFCSTISDPKTQIAVASFKDPSRKTIGKADHPYSLMEGIAGEGCLCIDIQNPEKASFPGYYNDLESTLIFKKNKRE